MGMLDFAWWLIVAGLIGFIVWIFSIGMWLWMGSALGGMFHFDRSKAFLCVMHGTSIGFALLIACAGTGFLRKQDEAERAAHKRWAESLITEVIVIEDVELAGRCRLVKTDNHPERLVAPYYADASQDKLVVGGRYEIRRERSLIRSHKRLPDVLTNAEDEAPSGGNP